MNTHDRILATLNLGGPFNDKQRVWRRLSTVATFAEKENDELLEIFAGDMVDLVVLRPSAQGRGIMVALKANVPLEEPDPQVQIMGGNAVNPNPMDDAAEAAPAEELAMANAPVGLCFADQANGNAPGGFGEQPIDPGPPPPPPNEPVLGGPGIPVPIVDQNMNIGIAVAPGGPMPIAELDVAQCELGMAAEVAGFEGIEEGEPNPLGDAAAELVDDAVAEDDLPPAQA